MGRFVYFFDLICFFSAYYIKFIIKRSRLCLDFTLTCHLIHAITVIIYNRKFPLNFVWWCVMILSAWVMTERSRSLCLFQELLPISVSNRSKIPENTSQSNFKRFNFSDIWRTLKLLTITTSKRLAFFESKKSSNSEIDLKNDFSSKSLLNPK